MKVGRPCIQVGSAHPTRIGQGALLEERLHNLFHEEGVALSLLQDELLQALHARSISHKSRQ